jgi:Flp pilus assembly protein TadB
MFLLCCCIVLGFDVSVCFYCVVVLYWVLTCLSYRNVKTQYNTTTQRKHTETSKPNTIQQHNKNIQKRQDPIQYNNTTNVSVCFCCVVVLSWVLTFLYVFVVLLYCIGSWRFCMFLLCCCIVLGLDVSVCFCIQYNSTTKTYRNVKTQYSTTTQQKHTETSKPNTIQQHKKNIQKLLCCCIVLGLDVSVCFCCAVVLYWVLTFLFVFVVLLYCIWVLTFLYVFVVLLKTNRNVKPQYNTTAQQKHTETSRPNTIQQHNKNIQKRQNPIQYNNTTKTYRNVKTQYNTTTQQKRFWRFCMFLLCCCIVLGLDVSVCFCCVVVLYWVLTFLYVFVVLLYCIGA